MMSVSSECCAFGCRNRPDYKLPGITFHVFPKDPVRRKAWIEAVRKKNIPDFEPVDYTKICSEHFSEECFDRSKKRVFLLAHAVPTIFGTPKSIPNVKHPLTKIYSNGAVKRKLSESEDENDVIFGVPYEDEDEDNSSSSESLQESEPEETPETEVVYVSEEAMGNNKPSIIKVVPGPGQSQPTADPDVQSALWAYRRLRNVAHSPSKQVSVLFMGAPHVDAVPPLPPGARLPRTPGSLEYRVWNQMKKLRSLKEENDNMLDEKDSPTVVPTNSINSDNKTCLLYPPAKTDAEKDLMQRTPPIKNTMERPIKIEYDTTFEEAYGHLSDVENECNIESDINQGSQRVLDNSSEEGSCSFQPPYPIPPPNPKKNYFSMRRNSSPTLSPTQMEETGNKKNKTDATGFDGRSSAKFVEPQAPHSYESMLKEVLSGQEKILIQLKQNEQLQRALAASVQRLEAKVDSIIAASAPKEETPNLELLLCLPLTLDEFFELEEKMKDSDSIRQQLKIILSGCYGKDCKGFVSCCLRRALKDEIGLQFSLTGKKHGAECHVNKMPFQTTCLYNIIREISLTSYADSKENVVREAISDWLLQAKFRIARRGKN